MSRVCARPSSNPVRGAVFKDEIARSRAKHVLKQPAGERPLFAFKVLLLLHQWLLQGDVNNLILTCKMVRWHIRRVVRSRPLLRYRIIFDSLTMDTLTVIIWYLNYVDMAFYLSHVRPHGMLFVGFCPVCRSLNGHLNTRRPTGTLAGLAVC